MFTGLVEALCPIVAVADHAAGRRLTVDLAGLARTDGLTPGESIALDGACLTVAALDGPQAAFDVVAETLRRTTLGRRRTGDRVNVERALRVGDRLGGHFVQGHVDGQAVLEHRDQTAREVVLRFAGPAELAEAMLPKGSVAIDGVSLTLVEVDRPAGRFSVALIPTTLAVTTLGFRRVGEPVNIETDLLGKWVRRHLADLLGPPGGGGGGLTLDKLRQAGLA